MSRGFVDLLNQLSKAGVTLRMRDGKLSASPAGRLNAEDIEEMRPWAETLKRISRRPLSPWRSESLAMAFKNSSPDLEHRLLRLMDIFDIAGIDDRRDPALFPNTKRRAS